MHVSNKDTNMVCQSRTQYKVKLKLLFGLETIDPILVVIKIYSVFRLYHIIDDPSIPPVQDVCVQSSFSQMPLRIPERVA